MTWVNLSDVEGQLSDADIVVDRPFEMAPTIQRWKTTKSIGADRPGWSRLKEWYSKAGHCYLVGCFGVWRGSEDGKLNVELPKRDAPERPSLSAEEIAAAKAAQAAAQKAIADERKIESKRAASWAAQVWSHCTPATQHGYLTSKRISANGARVLTDTAESVSYTHLVMQTPAMR